MSGYQRKLKVGEWLQIGDDIQVKVLEIKGIHVKLGVVAPDERAIEYSHPLNQIVGMPVAKSVGSAPSPGS